MIKISTRGQYALLIMTSLAEQDPNKYVPLKLLSHRHNLSVKYLEQILIQLSKAGMVDGLRGNNGGYKLNRKPEEYTAGEILRATEGPLSTHIDLPVTVSPIIAGLIFILIFGRQSPIYPLLMKMHLKVVFAVPGIILATVFVTFPFVSRELIPVLNTQGSDEEEAAALMGANFFTIFTKITFPHIKWPFLYGVVLCTARAMGEFGAVSVLSGHIRGKTNTLPLHVEILFNEFHYYDAFAVSSILVMMAIIVLIIRSVVEHFGNKAETL